MTSTFERIKKETAELIEQYHVWCSKDFDAVKTSSVVWEGREVKLTIDHSSRMKQILARIGIHEIWDSFTYIVDNEPLSRVSFSISNADFDEVDVFLETLQQAGLTHFAKAFNITCLETRLISKTMLGLNVTILNEENSRTYTKKSFDNDKVPYQGFFIEKMYFNNLLEASSTICVSPAEIERLRLSKDKRSFQFLSQTFPKVVTS